MRNAITAGMTAFAVAAAATTAFAVAAPTRPVSHPTVARPQAVKRNAALATYTLYGGGATLPVPGYTGSPSKPNGTVLNSFTSGSGFGYWTTNHTGDAMSYCVAGSGAGRTVFIGTNAASSTCNTGFSAPAGQTATDFAASDAPLASSEYTTYTTNAGMSGSNIFGRGEPVQVPAIVGSIAIALNYSGNGHTVPTSISLAGICGVFNGNDTTWDQVFGNGDTSSIANVVYRSDSSGTTFNFSNFLTNACGTFTINGTSGIAFNVDSAYGTNVMNAINSHESTGKIPATFLGENGNGGVLSTINSTSNSIGYIESGYYSSSFASTKLLNVTWNGGNRSPLKDLPPSGNALSLTVGTGCTSGGLLIDCALPAFSAPTLGGYQPAPTALSPTTAGCVVLVNPSAIYSAVSGGTVYPIIAVSYLMASSAGNGTDKATGLQDLFKQFATLGDFGSGKITTINAPGSSLFSGGTGYTEPNLTGTGTGNYVSTITSAAGCIGS